MVAEKARPRRRRITYSYYIMVFPAIVLVAIFSYGPLAGWAMAFQDWQLVGGLFGSPWNGLDNFIYLFTRYPNFWNVIRNTLVISSMKIVARFITPIVVALLLNELISERYKRVVQTLIYLPHFISWVVLCGILIDVLSPTDGIVNQIIKAMGFQPIYFLGTPSLFPGVIVVSDVWKEFGFSTIMYMAALTGIDQEQYEAATIDGASRFKRVLHITIPGIVPIMVLLGVLSLGNLLNAGFDQIFNLYNPAVYSTADVLETFTYRIGFDNWQYGLGTAVGIIKSFVSMILIAGSYLLAYKFADYRIF